MNDKSPANPLKVVPEIGDVRVAETPYGGRWMIEIYDECEYTEIDKWLSHRGSYESQADAERALESFKTFTAMSDALGDRALESFASFGKTFALTEGSHAVS